jgi:tryptophan-rich sensory protein
VAGVYCCKTGITMMDWMEWYNALKKPDWTPAPSTIGTIWSVLYPVIIVTFSFVYVQVGRRKLPPAVAFPFTLRNMVLASIDILIVWASIIWCILAIRRHYLWVAIAQLPYLAWVSLATVLQLSITWMNR